VRVVELYETANIVNPAECWCVRWRTESMRASAFWYFKTYREAFEAARDLWRL
jgi:hypothetical protein